MSKKVNPRRQPASKADVKRAELRGRDDGIKFASALFLMALRDKEGFDLEALQKVWKEVGDLADSIAEGYCSIVSSPSVDDLFLANICSARHRRNSMHDCECPCKQEQRQT